MKRSLILLLAGFAVCLYQCTGAVSESVTDSTNESFNSDDDDDDSTSPSGITIGVDGGVVAGPDGSYLTIGPGALDSDVEITISAAEVSAPVEKWVSLGSIYLLEPEGLTFMQPVTMTMPFSVELLPNRGMISQVTAFHSPDRGVHWVNEHGFPEPGTVTVEIDHFSWIGPGYATGNLIDVEFFPGEVSAPVLSCPLDCAAAAEVANYELQMTAQCLVDACGADGLVWNEVPACHPYHINCPDQQAILAECLADLASTLLDANPAISGCSENIFVYDGCLDDTYSCSDVGLTP